MRLRIAVLLCAVLLVWAGCGRVEQESKVEQEEGSTQEVLEEDGQSQECGMDKDTSSSQEEEEKAQIPDFEMTLLDGNTVSLEQYRGKKVLVNFWATWCGPCVGEMPAFEKLAGEYEEELVILAVNCSEDKETVEKFIQDNGYTFPVVLDEEGKIQAMFGGVTSIPLTVIIDEEGYVVSSSAGASDADSMYEVYKESLGL